VSKRPSRAVHCGTRPLPSLPFLTIMMSATIGWVYANPDLSPLTCTSGYTTPKRHTRIPSSFDGHIYVLNMMVSAGRQWMGNFGHI
jgi:hypothetical protein